MHASFIDYIKIFIDKKERRKRKRKPKYKKMGGENVY
jgi:hypothetical protein